MRTQFVPLNTAPLRAIEAPSPAAGERAIQTVIATWTSRVAAAGSSGDRRHVDLERELYRVSQHYGQHSWLIAGSCATPQGAVGPLRSLLTSYADHLDSCCARHEAEIARDDAEKHFHATVVCKPGLDDGERKAWRAAFAAFLAAYDDELPKLADASDVAALHELIGRVGVSLARRIEEAEPLHTTHPGLGVIAAAMRLLPTLRAAYAYLSPPTGNFELDAPSRRLPRSRVLFDRKFNEEPDSRAARYAEAVRVAADRDLSAAFAHVARALHALTGHVPLSQLPAPSPPPPARPPVAASAPF